MKLSATCCLFPMQALSGANYGLGATDDREPATVSFSSLCSRQTTETIAERALHAQ